MTREEEQALRSELRAVKQENDRLRALVEGFCRNFAQSVGYEDSDAASRFVLERLRMIADEHAFCMSQSRRQLLEEIHRLTTENARRDADNRKLKEQK